MKVVFSSQFRDSSGYASAARSYLKALDTVASKYDIDIKVLPISVEDYRSLSPEWESLISKYELRHDEVEDYIKEDYLLIWHQPAGMILYGDGKKTHDKDWLCFKKLLDNSTKNVNMTVWEADKIPDLWKTIYR